LNRQELDAEIASTRRYTAELMAERDEAQAQMAAMAEVLQAINAASGDLAPVFDALLEKAMRLCEAAFGMLNSYDGTKFRTVAMRGVPARYAEFRRSNPPLYGPGTSPARLVAGEPFVHVHDAKAEDMQGDPNRRALVDLGGARTVLAVPLLKDRVVVGMFAIYRQEVRPFTERQIALLQSFAVQASLALENARLFNEVQARTAELTEALTYQTGSSNILNVIASSPTDVEPVLKAIVESACGLCEANDAVVLLKDGDHLYFRAHYGPVAINLDKWPINRNWSAGRALLDRKPVHVRDMLSEEGADFPDVGELAQHSGFPVRSILAVPLLGDNEGIGSIVLRRTEVHPFSDKQVALLQTFADQAVIAIQNVRLFDQVQARTRELSASLDDLRTAQDRLVQTEKLASLGQLTAGIAHEIKNPLNFVNNFAALSAELIDELDAALAPPGSDANRRDEIGELTRTLKGNLEKIVQHGKRADSIVKNMLLHSREGSGEHRPADINAIVEESLNLAYHGARAEKPDFNVTIERDFDRAVGNADIYPQEVTRVFLNLIANGFYAAALAKKQSRDPGFEPTLRASTRNLGDKIEIRLRDNGVGIAPDVRDKIFNPFFTTKPAGEGTGLGLSMSHDIIVKQHGGRIDIESEPNKFTEIIVTLPRGPIRSAGVNS